jgi:hypothetical protein
MSMDDDSLPFLVDLLRLTGSNVDPAGTATLFARLEQLRATLNQVAGFTDQVEGYTDTLETILGLTGDAANASGNIMQRLAQLILFTDTLEVTSNAIKPKTDLIGAAADAGGTGTLFARLAQIAALSQSSLNYIGTSADGSARNSSLFAFLKALDSKSTGTDLFAMIPNVSSVFVASTSVAANGYLDLLTISGKGILQDFGVVINNISFGVIIVIDGVSYNYYTYFATLSAASILHAGDARFLAPSTTAPSPSIVRASPQFRFNSSCIIRIFNVDTAAHSYVTVELLFRPQ